MAELCRHGREGAENTRHTVSIPPLERFWPNYSRPYRLEHRRQSRLQLFHVLQDKDDPRNRSEHDRVHQFYLGPTTTLLKGYHGRTNRGFVKINFALDSGVFNHDSVGNTDFGCAASDAASRARGTSRSRSSRPPRVSL